ncbi:MAG: ABC transporter ATP-binding protein [Peptostreptococcaceae bacterium]|nr:ABC transporter ATP-binding protein [Peptostreptococcaceae bacterium]
MFITKALLRFSKESIGRSMLVSIIELGLTLFASVIMLLSSIAVRLLLGADKVLFFDSIEQVFSAIVLFIALRFVLSKTRTIEATKCSVEIKEKLRLKLLKKLYSLGPAYTAQKRTGAIATTIWGRVEWLNNYYSKYLPVSVSASVNAFLIIGMIAYVDKAVALITFFCVLLILITPMFFYNVMNRMGHAEWNENAKYYSDCLDGIQGMQTLKALNANKIQREKIHHQGEVLRRSIMKHLNITIVENCFLEFFVRAGSFITVAVAAIRFNREMMDAQQLIFLLFLATACFKPMFHLITAWHIGYRGVTGAASIAELLEEERYPALYDTAGSFSKPSFQDPEGYRGDIEFQEVSFSYTEAEGKVLDRISFQIKENSVTALIGASGSGKSTIAHLLAGFYRADEGIIQVGGKVLSKETVIDIQDLITAVWQDGYIFYGSFYENILIGDPTATKSEVEQAAKDANIHEFIMSLEKGYDTVLGERGLKLSGGERQRVAIARAFLRDSPILIFDEATSSLDRKNEIEIQKSFRKLIQNKTVLVIAHRLETIRDADRICILDKGKIRAFGTHQQLMRSSQDYVRWVGDRSLQGEGECNG